jgi:hypothetical protein
MRNPPERSGGKKGFFVKLYGKWQILIEKCMGCISVDFTAHHYAQLLGLQSPWKVTSVDLI